MISNHTSIASTPTLSELYGVTISISMKVIKPGGRRKVPIYLR